MLTRLWSGIRLALLALVALPMWSGIAAAQYCPSTNISSLTATSMNVGTYDPFSATVPKIVTVTITTRASCAISLTFFRNPIAAVMTSGASTLSYQIEAVGGGNSYISLSGFVPPVANRIDIVTSGAQTVTRQVQVRVVASQIVADGTYTDTGVSMILASQSGASWYQVATTAVTPSATVPKICRLDAPSPATLTFAATDIPNGIPTTSVIQSTSMTAACTAPTIVRLTGSAMTPTPSITAVGGFDNFLNYRAVGTFGSATTTLTTTTTVASASSAAKNVASGATTSGTVSVNVNMIAGNPILSGSYSGVLTVTIDPNL